MVTKEVTKKILVNETDATGVVYFAAVLRIAQEIFELALLDRFSNLHQAMTAWKMVIPIRAVHGDFFKPMVLSEEVKIKLSISRIGEKSFEVSTTWTNKANEVTAATAITHVCVESSSFVTSPLPQELQNWLASL